MAPLTPGQWKKFKNVIHTASKDFGHKEITWRRSRLGLDRWQEDNAGTVDIDVTLNVLCNYNYMRTWPITLPTDSGELDRQSVQLIFSKPELALGGYITPEGNFNYNPDYDRFIMDGLVYKPFGDTPVSQAHDEDLLISIIVKREETNTSEKVRP